MKILITLAVLCMLGLLLYHAAGMSAPAISSIFPVCMDLGGIPPGITISGSGFKGNSYVTVNGQARDTYAPSSMVRQVQLTAADVAAEASLAIAVVNPKPSPVSSNVMLFSVMDTPMIILTSSLPDAIQGIPYSVDLQAVHKSLCTGNLLP